LGLLLIFRKTNLALIQIKQALKCFIGQQRKECTRRQSSGEEEKSRYGAEVDREQM